MIEVKGFAYSDGNLGAHVHLPNRQCASFSFHEVGVEHPALGQALEEVERCIAGAIILGSREIASERVPESPEVEIGLCKICSGPVRKTDPGARTNGPFIYCRACA